MQAALRSLAVPVLTGLLGGLLLLWWLGPRAATSERPPAPLVVHSYADVVEQATPAVANIYTTQVVQQQRNVPSPFLPPSAESVQRERVLSSLGSGVIVSPSGYMLTSYHVIQNADEIIVALADGREAVAQVVGTDPETDLALLHIDLKDLPFIAMDQGAAVRTGDVVLAIGNPLGMGQTVSMGIVSATGRSRLGLQTFENYIQTDAAINEGNSGGALIDTHGQLVGINAAILTRGGSWEGIGFATPVSTARAVMQDLIQHGRVIRGWLGVSVSNLSPTLAREIGLSEVRGGIIQDIVVNGPAHRAGLLPGDVLVAVDGKLLRDGYEAMQLIAGSRPGTRLQLTVMRHREEHVITVEIGIRPTPRG